MTGLLLVISGPSGVGKGTLVHRLLQINPNVRVSISATTRKPRPGEEDGVSYFFKTEEEFSQMVEKGQFFEYAQVFGKASYGTPLSQIDQRKEGTDVILEIDVQGAAAARAKEPDALLIFVAPPSFAELRRRLTGRGTEAAADVERRLAEASRELSRIAEFDYVICNDEVERTADVLNAIIQVERERRRGKEIASALLDEMKDGSEDK